MCYTTNITEKMIEKCRIEGGGNMKIRSPNKKTEAFCKSAPVLMKYVLEINL